MPKKIENKDIFSPDFLEPQKKSFKELIELIKLMEAELKDVLKVQQDLVKTSDKKSVEGLKKRKQAVESVNRVSKEMQSLEKQKVRLNKQLQQSTDKEIAGKLRLQRANKEQRDSLKAEIVLKDKLAGTEEKLIAKNTLLRLARKKLNLETRKGRKDLRDINKALDRNNKQIDKNSDKLKKQKRNVGNYASALKGVGSALRGIGLTIGVGSLIRNIGDIFTGFQSEAANLASVLGKTRKEAKLLTDDAKRLGATTSFTAKDVIKLQTAFAKLGFKEKEILAATEATLSLAAATGTDLDRAAEVAASTIRGFGLEASDTQMVVDVMAKSFSTSSLDMEKFATAMASVAPASKAAGVSLNRTTALIGTITDAGIDASTAGTALRNIFLDLSKSGKTFDQAMKEIRESSNKNATAMELFGKRGAVVAQVLADGGEKAKELEKGLNNAGGAAKKMADEQLDTLTGRTKLMTSAWEGFILSLEDGEGVFAQVANTVVEGITNMLNKMSDLGKSAGQLQSELTSERMSISQGHVNDILQEQLELFEKSNEELQELAKNGNKRAKTELDHRKLLLSENQKIITIQGTSAVFHQAELIRLKQELATRKKNGEVFNNVALRRKIDFAEGFRDAEKQAFQNRLKIATEQELIELAEKQKIVGKENWTQNIAIAAAAARELQRRKDIQSTVVETGKASSSNRSKELTGLEKIRAELSKIMKLRSDELVANGDTQRFQQLNRESKELQDQIEFLEAKLKLEEEGHQRIEGRKADTDSNEEILKEETEAVDDFVDVQVDGLEEVEDIEKQVLQDRLAALREFSEKAIEIADAKTDKQIENIDKEIEASKSREQQLQALATQGNLDADKSIGAEIKRQAELERQKEALEKKKARRQIILEGLDLLSSKIDNGEKDAVTSTLNDMTRLLGALSALPGFIDGTDTTVGAALGKPQLNTGTDDYIVRVDGAEKILNPGMSARTGNMTTEEITRAAEMYSNGMFDQNLLIQPKVAQLNQPFQDQTQILKKFDSLESTIRNKPILSDLKFDELSKALVVTVEQNGDLKRTHYKLKK